jgi:lipoprotein-anchoring transpeptidase ErfK/SrfK
VAAYTEKTGRTIDATDARSLMEQLMETGGPAVTSYTITNEDVSGPYVAAIPEDYSHKAALPAMSYTRVTEMLGERFHMDEDYLREINPGADFNRPGTIIKVMATGEPVTGEVVKIIADKGREQVRAYDASGQLVAAYPSSIGSTSTPSPSGIVEVKRIAFDPNYTYNPKINFKQGTNDKILTIPPGPNGPVGTIWIALSKPTYGIHGTPEPSKIGKTNSHGCIRLTNWDATELAKMVKPGTVVEFTE